MDNDINLVKKIKKIYKTLKFKHDYRGYYVLNASKGNELISKMVLNNVPVMIGRCGATEMRCVEEYLNTGKFTNKIKSEIQNLSGVFPTTDDTLKKFCEYYMECVSQADLLALWGVGAESKVVKSKCKSNTSYCELESLEPYYFERPWSENLKGKRVLVIHPFVESIQKQYQKREKLFNNKNILPEFKSLTCIKAVQSIASEKTEYGTWFEALNSMKKQIEKYEFDVAIIGAGAYSLPLAAYVKELGKTSIQMSGSTQILFGIKGKRWESIPKVSKHFNEEWIKPSDSETPKDNKIVEGGSYW